MTTSIKTILNAFGSRVNFHEWTPLAVNRYALLERYWIQFVKECPYSHIHPSTRCFCGCPGSTLNLLDSIAMRPVSYVCDFYRHIMDSGLVSQDDPTFQQTVARSLFKNRRNFTPLEVSFMDADGKQYTDSFLWILENVLLPTTIRDSIEENVKHTDAAEEVPVNYTLFHCLFELDSVRYYPEPEKYTRRMIVAFYNAGFDFTTPGCPSLMTRAILTSNTDLITALDQFGVPFTKDCGNALLFRIRVIVGELCGMSHSTLDFFDRATEHGRNLHNEKLIWASVANTVYHSTPLLRAFADEEEDDETRKLRLTGLLTAIHPRFSKYTSAESSYAHHYLKDDVDRILLPSDKNADALMKLLEVLHVAGFDFSAKYTWDPFYGETAPPPMTPRNFYEYCGRVVRVLDPVLDTAILAALKH